MIQKQQLKLTEKHCQNSNRLRRTKGGKALRAPIPNMPVIPPVRSQFLVLAALCVDFGPFLGQFWAFLVDFGPFWCHFRQISVCLNTIPATYGSLDSLGVFIHLLPGPFQLMSAAQRFPSHVLGHFGTWGCLIRTHSPPILVLTCETRLFLV